MRTPKILTTLKTYDRRQFLADIVAGVTVAMVALPLSLAISIASGAPPVSGFVTAIVGGFLISAFGGSRVQIGGPTGAFIVVVFGVIADHGYDGLLLATFMAGLMLLVAGWFRAGRLIGFVPEAVVNGFTIGIAIIIAVSQIKDVLGLDVSALPADFVPKIAMIADRIDTVDVAFAVVAACVVAAMLVLKRIWPRFPGALVAVGGASALVVVSGISIDTIGSRFGHLPTAFPMPAIPEVSADRLIDLFPSAVTIAFLAGVESLLSAMVADRMIEGKHRPNAELTAQGVANIGSALFSGLPATGAIARTATNVRAGGQTPVAGIVHAIILLAIFLIAAPVAELLALPALGALLMLTAWSMSEPQKWGEYARGSNSDRLLLVMTLVLTVLIDLTVAIGIGVAVGLALRLNRRKSVESDCTPPER